MAYKVTYTFLEMVLGVWPPMLLSQGISFCDGLGFCLGELEDTPEFFSVEDPISSFVEGDRYHQIYLITSTQGVI
jgi:hypothetical protein